MDNCYKIIFPMDGDMLNERDGCLKGNSLFVKVKIKAPKALDISVNGKKAELRDGFYVAEVELKNYKNLISVIFDNDTKETITVYKLLNITGKYRLSLDDNIWFLQDITQNQDVYKSIFDNPYLRFLKQIHDTYGTKIHINIYFKSEDGYTITKMPTKFKDEWIKNRDRIRLSFHAYANLPDRPYKNAPYKKVFHDCEEVLGEIKRFAGEELLGPVTTLHWGEATVEGCMALRDLGYKCLVGDFNVDNELSQRVPVSYYLDIEKRRNILNRFIWKDNRQDIIFFRSAIIIDSHKRDAISSFLDDIYNNPHQSSYMDLLIHEQYFYKNYVSYQPDYTKKVDTAVRWAVEKGYRPAFLEECIFK